jgi:regulation of enolase protein 1 (concanavalin A-like superfamily)
MEVPMTAVARVLVGTLAVSLLLATTACSMALVPPGEADWGKVTDPDGDCRVKAEKGKLTITVPAKTHDLNPLNGTNAPRVLRQVQGDFTATVKVTGDFKPGNVSTNPNGAPFNGAGLLLWQDANNFLRLERNNWWHPNLNKYICYPPLIEYYKDGNYQSTNPEATAETFFKGNITFLRLERKGNKVTASYSHDGKQWTAVKEISVTLPQTLHVGVSAVNTANQPFTVVFEEFQVTGAGGRAR